VAVKSIILFLVLFYSSPFYTQPSYDLDSSEVELLGFEGEETFEQEPRITSHPQLSKIRSDQEIESNLPALFGFGVAALIVAAMAVKLPLGLVRFAVSIIAAALVARSLLLVLNAPEIVPVILVLLTLAFAFVDLENWLEGGDED